MINDVQLPSQGWLLMRRRPTSLRVVCNPELIPQAHFPWGPSSLDVHFCQTTYSDISVPGSQELINAKKKIKKIKKIKTAWGSLKQLQLQSN